MKRLVQFQAIPGADMLIIFALDADGELWEGTIVNSQWDDRSPLQPRWARVSGPLAAKPTPPKAE